MLKGHVSWEILFTNNILIFLINILIFFQKSSIIFPRVRMVKLIKNMKPDPREENTYEMFRI